MKKATSLKQIGIDSDCSCLILMPHPDDETASTAGLIQKLIKQGSSTRVVVVTRGEKSTLKYCLCDTDNLPEIRTAELKSAVSALGCQNFKQYSLPDGGVENCVSDLSELIDSEVRTFNPDLVVTLEPSGIYGHPDHIALSKAVTMTANSKNLGLIYATVGPDFKQSENIRMAKDPDHIDPIAPNLKLQLNPIEIYRKVRAIRAHKSQFNRGFRVSWDWFRKGMLTTEYFHQVT